MPTRRPGRIRRGRCWLCGLILVGLLSPMTAHAEATVQARAQIKAAYLLNFARFLRWPAERNAQALELCLSATAPTATILAERLQGERAGTRWLRVTRYAADVVPLADRCDVLYIERAQAVPEGAVLTVGEGSGHLERGGTLAFVDTPDRVRFAIHRGNVTARGLDLDARLYAAAVEVIQ